MALIACSECSHQISDQAAACTQCGAPVRPAGDVSKADKFQDPKSKNTTDISNAGVYTFFFGPLYFALKGVWTHAIVSLGVALLTMGFSWLIYPFLSRGIMRKHYASAGWVPLDAEPTPETHVSCPDCKKLVRKEALACPHCSCKLIPQ